MTNIDQKLLEIEFLIAICLPPGDKWQSRTMFLVIFDPCLSIVQSVFALSPIECNTVKITFIQEQYGTECERTLLRGLQQDYAETSLLIYTFQRVYNKSPDQTVDV